MMSDVGKQVQRSNIYKGRKRRQSMKRRLCHKNSLLKSELQQAVAERAALEQVTANLRRWGYDLSLSLSLYIYIYIYTKTLIRGDDVLAPNMSHETRLGTICNINPTHSGLHLGFLGGGGGGGWSLQTSMSNAH
jgi:hypothetical protein